MNKTEPVRTPLILRHSCLNLPRIDCAVASFVLHKNLTAARPTKVDVLPHHVERASAERKALVFVANVVATPSISLAFSTLGAEALHKRNRARRPPDDSGVGSVTVEWRTAPPPDG